MVKSIFKEIIIILLLIVTIILLLGILFYDYMPNSKVLPEKAQDYVLAEDVKEELEQDSKNMNTEEIVKTYQLDATDLQYYEKTKEYDKGKVNPFAEYSNKVTNNAENNTTLSGNNTTNNNSGFLNITGK